jgi:hypothetical protein
MRKHLRCYKLFWKATLNNSEWSLPEGFICFHKDGSVKENGAALSMGWISGPKSRSLIQGTAFSSMAINLLVTKLLGALFRSLIGVILGFFLMATCAMRPPYEGTKFLRMAESGVRRECLSAMHSCAYKE